MQTEPHNFKARIRSGETLIGAFVCFRTGDAAEVMGYCGFDFLIMDSEHSSFGPEAVQELVRATEVTGAIPLVRVAEIRSSYVQWALDSGAQGILFPGVRSAEDARRAVGLCRYPPDGIRGLGPGRASRYGSLLRQYQASANQDIVVLIQVETLEAVADLPKITEVAEVDLIFIGPGDLSQALGVPGQLTHPRVLEVIDQIVSTCRPRNIPLGSLVLDPESVPSWIERGIHLIVVGSDSFFLLQGCQNVLQRLRGKKK